MIEAEGIALLFTQGYKYLFAVLSTTDLYLPMAIEMAAVLMIRQAARCCS